MNDVRWIQGGHRGRGPHSSNVLIIILECSVTGQDPRCSWNQEYSTSTIGNSLSDLLCTNMKLGTTPLRPPHDWGPHHVVSVPRSSPPPSPPLPFFSYTFSIEWMPFHRLAGQPLYTSPMQIHIQHCCKNVHKIRMRILLNNRP